MSPGEAVEPVVVHTAGRIEYTNQAFRELLGLDASPVGQSVQDFVAEEYRESLTAQFEELTAEPRAGLALTVRTTDGTERDAIAVSSPVEWDGTERIQTTFIEVLASDDRPTVALTEQAANQSPTGITIADATREDDPLIYVNETFTELTGYAREEVLGRNCRFLQGEATRPEPVAEMRAAIQEERPVTVELRNYRKDGSMFWNRVTLSPVEDASGTVTHVLGYQEDISAEKIYEREKTLFETQTEQSEQVMFLTDSEGVIEYVNPAFERVTGYSAADAIGNTPAILNSGEQDDAFYDDLWETITAGDTWEADLINQTKSGELYEAHQKIIPITDDHGEITHFAAIEPDITDERLTEQVLTVLNRILRHNVRTAVNVIDGYTELLKDAGDETDRDVAIEAIQNRTAALEEISEQTKSVRNLLTGYEDTSPVPASTLESVVDRFRTENPAVTIDLSMTIPEDRLIRNGAVFQIALEEAISYAVSHIEAAQPRIDIAVTERGDTARIEIVDNGPGIPESEWEIVKQGTETPLEHTDGIGLWLVYWSITALGGTVDITTHSPEGSTLTLEVPLVDQNSHD